MNIKKKGFTIVELVIVIAVIAILAVVLVPTFMNLVERANMSSDQRAVRDMNTLLALEEVKKEKMEFEDVIEVLSKGGYEAKNYKPLTKKAAFYWIENINRIILANEETKELLFPKNLQGVPTYGSDSWIPLITEVYKDPYLLEWEDAPIATVPNCEIDVDLRDDSLTSAAQNTGDFYTFRPKDDLTSNDPKLVEQREKYKDWIADFAIILNDDFKDQSAGIAGSYFGIPWQYILVPGDQEKGTVFYLMDAYQGIKITYESLLELCAPDSNGQREGFHCGAFNYDNNFEGVDNSGKSITVQLRLYEPNEENLRLNYVVCVEIECKFRN